MQWTKEDANELRAWRKRIDSDNIKIKEKVKEELLKNKYIIHALDNKELENADSEPEDYYGINILPYYIIAPVQTTVQNYLCFETSFDEEQRYNNTAKLQQLIFYVLCHNKDIKDRETSLARHDLIAALILDQFNWTNLFGKKIHCVSDRPSVVDNDFACRTLIFEQITNNSLVKSTNEMKVPRLANKDIVE